MILHSPFMISARLMAAIKIVDCTISIGYGKPTSDGRARYDIYFDFADGRVHHETKLRSGVGGGTLQSGMGSLLEFLGAASDAHASKMRGQESDLTDLFPEFVMKWAYQNSDEISMVATDIVENDNLIEP